MHNRTRELTEGAMMCAIAGVLLAFGRQAGGLFDTYLIWIIPLPLIIYSSRYGAKSGFWVAVALVLVSFLTAAPTTVFYVGGSALLGIAYGWGLKRGKSNNWLLGTAVLGSLSVTLVTTVLFAGVFGYDINDDIELLNQMIAYFKVAVPAGWNLSLLVYVSIFAGCFLEGFLIHLLAYLVLRKLKISFPQFAPLEQLRLPKWLALLTGGLLLGYLLAGLLTGGSRLTEILLLVTLPALMIDVLAGYLTVIVACRSLGFRYGGIAVVVLLFLLPTVTMPFLALTGILDPFLDLRGMASRR